MSITDADKALDIDGSDVPVLRIGEFWLTHCAHGGLWLAKDGGEGMQMAAKTLIEFEKALEAFWNEHF